MLPPRYSPAAVTMSKVMAVPKSTISIALPGKSALAPTAAANRSTPRVAGVA
jgi:hypothetical protein